MSFITQSSHTVTGSQEILNSLKSTELDVTVLTDPVVLEAYKQHVADQMNAQRGGGPKFEDLSNRIADIIIETSAQGASLLEVHVIDPGWLLLLDLGAPDSAFIQVDDSGLLWPPIDVNFPKGTDQVWRLVQVRAASDLDQANMVLTFEDRICAQLRDVAGPEASTPGETLGRFIERLVGHANVRAGGQSVPSTDLTGNQTTLGAVNVAHTVAGVPAWTPIRLVELIAPTDPNYTAPTSNPASADPANPPASPARQHPNKEPGGLTQSQQLDVNAALGAVNKAAGQYLLGAAGITMSEIERNIAEFFGGSGSHRVTGYTPTGEPIIGGPAGAGG